jgi:hypothetical protein
MQSSQRGKQLHRVTARRRATCPRRRGRSARQTRPRLRNRRVSAAPSACRRRRLQRRNSAAGQFLQPTWTIGFQMGGFHAVVHRSTRFSGSRECPTTHRVRAAHDVRRPIATRICRRERLSGFEPAASSSRSDNFGTVQVTGHRTRRPFSEVHCTEAGALDKQVWQWNANARPRAPSEHSIEFAPAPARAGHRLL